MSAENLYTPNRIRTYSGIYIDITRIQREEVHPVDIAYGLARECRFGNHTQKFYSVAEHSIWCMQKGQQLHPGDRSLHLRLLMHDAHEAYMGDWCTPLLDSMGWKFREFKHAVTVTKRMVQGKIDDRFGITKPCMDCEDVKKIDKLALEWEWEHKVITWTGLAPMPDKEVAEMWLHYFKELVRVPVVVGGSL